MSASAAAPATSGVKRKREANAGGDGDGRSAGGSKADPDSKSARRRTLLQQARHIDVAPVPAIPLHGVQRATLLNGANGSGASSNASASNNKTAAGLVNMTYQPQPAVLPTHLALAAHIQARSFQLESFQRALVAARTSANMRAWQLLPRHARRRAASHNLLRVPKRLRVKALSELKASNTLALTKAQIRRRFGDDLPLSRSRKRTAILLLRAAAMKASKEAAAGRKARSQLKSNTALSLAKASKTAAQQSSHWLETHLWHAKRFHLSSHTRSHPKHGRDVPATQRAEAETHYPFALAYRPHMKGHRAAVRASLHQCTLRDVSWWSWTRVSVRLERPSPGATGTSMEVNGQETYSMSAVLLQQAVSNLLKEAGARDGWQAEWQSGSRMCYTTLLGPVPNLASGSDPKGKGKARQLDDISEPVMPLCHANFPLNIIWLASKGDGVQQDTTRRTKGKSSRHRKKIRERAAADRAANGKNEHCAGPPSGSQHASGPGTAAASSGTPYCDEDDMDDYMNAHDDEDDMDALMNGGADDDDEDGEIDCDDRGDDQGGDLEKTKQRRKYHRSKQRSVAQRPGAASLPQVATTDQGAAKAGQSKTDAVVVMLQSHPSCTPYLVKVLRRAASRLNSRSVGTLVVEIQELNTAPSAGVAVGRGRAALATSGRQGNVVQLMKDGNAAKKPMGGAGASSFSSSENSHGRDGSLALEGYNAFELIGPEAGRLLGGILKPVLGTATQKLEVLEKLSDPRLHNVAPSGWALALDVYDPRLSFPPRLPRRPEQPAREPDATIEKDTDFHDFALVHGRLFLEGGPLPKFSKGSIDRRRAKNLVPGTCLKPSGDDDVVPVIIIQRSMSAHAPIVAGAPSRASASSGAPDPADCMHGYTLLVPRGWGASFFHSLSYLAPTPVKVIALQQARQQVLESGSAISFPHDWPHSAPKLPASPASAQKVALFDRWARALGNAEWTDWNKRPPAKRENFDAKGVRWPFGPAFDQRSVDGPVGLNPESDTANVDLPMWDVLSSNALRLARTSKLASMDGEAGALLATILDATRSDNNSSHSSGREYWLCCLRSLMAASTQTLAPSAAPAFALAYVPVRVQACRKGLFGQWAEIHMIPSAEEAVKWRSMLNVMESDRKRGEAMGEELGAWTPPEPTAVARVAQPASTHIGTVTSGDYALTQGRSFAVGVIPLVAWLELCLREDTISKAEATSSGATNKGKKKRKKAPSLEGADSTTKTRRNAIPKRALVFVRERTSELYRLASVEALVP